MGHAEQRPNLTEINFVVCFYGLFDLNIPRFKNMYNIVEMACQRSIETQVLAYIQRNPTETFLDNALADALDELTVNDFFGIKPFSDHTCTSHYDKLRASKLQDDLDEAERNRDVQLESKIVKMMNGSVHSAYGENTQFPVDIFGAPVHARADMQCGRCQEEKTWEELAYQVFTRAFYEVTANEHRRVLFGGLRDTQVGHMSRLHSVAATLLNDNCDACRLRIVLAI